MEPTTFIAIICGAITIIGSIFGVGWKLHQEFSLSKKESSRELERVSDNFTNEIKAITATLQVTMHNFDMLMSKSEERWKILDAHGAESKQLSERIRQIESRLDKAGM
jgi:peptidoglycan hydrolase CwlO-like protein